MADAGQVPRWREDFPIRWDDDHYMTRRELAKFLTLGSGLLAGTTFLIAAIGLELRPAAAPAVRVAGINDVPPGTSVLFRYPTAEDPCILVRDTDGSLHAYSQVCTHLSCAVVHRPSERTLFCPCHEGVFGVADGRPIAGPPTRRLPRIVIDQQGPDLMASGVEI